MVSAAKVLRHTRFIVADLQSTKAAAPHPFRKTSLPTTSSR
jgi:hypothetical protein